jgi:hypothetical protein
VSWQRVASFVCTRAAAIVIRQSLKSMSARCRRAGNAYGNGGERRL